MPSIMHRRLNIPPLINPNAISNSSQNNLTAVPQVYKQGNYRRKLVLSMLSILSEDSSSSENNV